MTYQDIQEVNNKLHNIEIKGSGYVPVKERIKAFRMMYPEGGIATEIMHFDDNKVVIKAVITDPEGRILSTGHACEVNGSTNINKMSFVENCETSAIGRALGAMGIGMDKAEKGFKQQPAADVITQDESEKLNKQLSDNQKIWIFRRYAISSLSELDRMQYNGILQTLEQRKMVTQIA